MIPLRLVLDTNVIVSAAVKPEGLQRTVLLLAMTKPACWYVSEAIVSEYALVLARPELKIRRGLRQQLLQLIDLQSCPDYKAVGLTAFSSPIQLVHKRC